MRYVTPVLDWVDDRLPWKGMWNQHMTGYYAPKNFNFWYYFGSLMMLVLGIQIVTGLVLAMHYKPDASLNASGLPVAFASVQYIMNDVPWGWWVRYMHSTGASAFFILAYLHMYRALLYGSYRAPRELLWVVGMVIFLALMAEAFFGYLLPWGQMSYWGAQVIINLFSAIPWIGNDLTLWIRGDYVVSDSTLNRFYVFHFTLPFILAGLVVVHLLALHHVGSNNPDGIDIKKHKDAKGHSLDGVPFHPYYTIKDSMGVMVFLFFFCTVVFFAPDMGGYFLEYNNFYPADPLKTPPHIAPVWYFTPFYSMLRASTISFWLDAKVWGVMLMGSAVLILFFLPWLDRSPVKSIRYRGPMFKTALAIFTISFLALGYLGTQPPPSEDHPWPGYFAKLFTVLYFLFFILMPFYTRWDRCKPVPERLT